MVSISSSIREGQPTSIGVQVSTSTRNMACSVKPSYYIQSNTRNGSSNTKPNIRIVPMKVAVLRKVCGACPKRYFICYSSSRKGSCIARNQSGPSRTIPIIIALSCSAIRIVNQEPVGRRCNRQGCCKIGNANPWS